jgi:hypothetical protein
MIHTEEDDEFDRITREAKMKGQPYLWEAEAIKAAVRMEREACAKLCEEVDLPRTADLIRARGNHD